MTLFEFNSFLTTNTNNKTNKHMKKLIAMLGAVVAAVTSAWAALPVAVWNDFHNLTSGDYTLTNNGCTVNEDGSITIGKIDNNNAGLVLNLASGNPIFDNKTLTLVIDAEIPAVTTQSMVMNIVQAGNNVSLGADTDGKLYQCWGTGHGYGNTAYTAGARHTYALRYKGVSNAAGKGTTTFVDGVKGGDNSGLMTGSGNITRIGIGSYNGKAENNAACPEGMKVYGAYLYATNLSDDEIVKHMYTGDYAKYNYSTIVNWRGTSAAFHTGAVSDLKADGTEDAYSLNTSGHPWQVFADNQTDYVAPGYILRLDSATANKTIQADFSPWTFGGLIVEEDGYSLTPSGRNDRGVTIGDPSGKFETYVDIKKNFTINRGTTVGNFVNGFYGTVNLTIADGKVFDYNSSQSSHPLSLRTSWGHKGTAVATTLKMIGGGQMKVATLTANGGTLDYSAQSLDRTTAFIDGNLTVDGNTSFVFPEGISAEKPLVLCSGTLTGLESGNHFSKQADGTYIVHKLTVDGNKITSVEIATDVNPAADKFCLYDWTFTGTLTSKGIYTNTLEWDTGYSASNGFLTDETFTYGQALNAQATPYVPPTAWSISYPTEWTCFVAGIAPSNVGGGLIVFGTTSGGAIGLVTTGEDKVSLVRTTGNSKYTVLADMTVPGAQTTSHAYTFVKTASSITVYLDGNLWNQTAVANATFGNKLQVGSIHGGTLNTGIEKAASGSIQAVRIMEGVQPAATIRAFSKEFPYHSPNGTYARTFDAGAQSWNAEEAWTSTKDEGNVAEPGAGLVQANFSGETTVSVNLAEDVTYESLTINNNESGAVTFVAAEGSAGSIKAAQMNVNAPVVLGEGAVDLAQGPITIGEEGSITFDFSGLPYAGAVAAYPFVEKVTGVVTQNDEKFILKAPAENDDFSLAIRYNEGNRYYEVAATYKKLVDVTIPDVTGATPTVSIGEKTVEIANGKVTVPATANLTVTYTANTGYTMGATTVTTVENVQEGATVDVTGITATINTYTVAVTSVENAKSMVKIVAVGSTAATTEAVECTTETVSLTHGQTFVCDYVAAEGYYLKSGSTHYQYSNVAQSYTTAYTVDCVFAKIVATIGESNYDSIQAAIDALTEEQTIADITVVDKTATLPEGYEDYTIDEDGKIVLAKTPTELFLEGIAAGGDVTLTGAVTLDAAAVIPADKTVTLDLNGCTITAPKTAISVLGTLTVKDNGTDGKIVSTGNCGIAVGNGATLTVNSGIIESVEGAIITGKAVGATITINDGTFSASDNAVIAGNGTKREGEANTITINGGTFNGAIKSAGYIACGIYAPWKDQITVDGGTFNITGGCGVCARAGTVAIGSGVTIKLTNEGTVSGWVGDNKNAVPGVQAFFDYAAKYPGLAEGDAIKSATKLTIADTQEWVGDTAPYTLADKKTSSDLPGAEEVPADQKDAYNTWAAENGITTETTAADATTAATAFVMGVTVAEGQTIAKAAALKADEMLKEIATTEGVDLAALLAQAQEAGADGLEVEGYDGLTVKLVPTTLGEEVQTSAKLFKLSITIKK